MKITGSEVIPVGKYLFIRINTDKGIHSMGEAGAWSFLDEVEGVLRRLESYLLGKDPFQIEHHWGYLYRNMYFRRSVIVSALSTIDITFWDIKGKALDVPVYKLLGGKCQDKIRSYEAVSYYTPEEMAEFRVSLKQKGHDAARLMATGDITRTQADRSSGIYNSKVRGYIERVRACRGAMGRDFDLILECHRSIDPCETIAFARGVKTHRPLLLEDPTPPDSLGVMVDVAKDTSILAVTEECFINIQEFETILQRRAVKYLRPDVCTLSGLTPPKKVAATAETSYARITPHNPLGPVSTAACLQLDAAIPSFTIQEFPSFYHRGNEAEMTTEPFQEEDGYIVVPDAPGIRVELAKDLTERFPPGRGNISVQAAYGDGVYDV